MKKLLILACAFALIFSACGENDKGSSKMQTIVVGATPMPHKEILEVIKPDLKAKNIELIIVEFQDYVVPNLSLADKSLDANFMQHKPYLDVINAERNLNLVSVAAVHVEPMGLYSKNISNISDLPNGASIVIPNDATNGARALILLHDKGLITLEDSSNLAASTNDIIKNPKQLKIIPIEAPLIPRVLSDYDAGVINTNFALQANLSAQDALIMEGAQSPYANIIAVRAGDENRGEISELITQLHSQKVRDFIETKYKGAVVPAF